MDNFSDLYGEPECGYVNVLSYCRPKKSGIYCQNCEAEIQFSEMKNWRKDDETVDKLCPGCDAVLIEGE